MNRRVHQDDLAVAATVDVWTGCAAMKFSKHFKGLSDGQIKSLKALYDCQESTKNFVNGILAIVPGLTDEALRPYIELFLEKQVVVVQNAITNGHCTAANKEIKARNKIHIKGYKIQVLGDWQHLYNDFSVVTESDQTFFLLGPLRFVNHGCRRKTMNCSFVVKKDSIGLTSCRRINEGEEICVNYGKDFWGPGECWDCNSLQAKERKSVLVIESEEQNNAEILVKLEPDDFRDDEEEKEENYMSDQGTIEMDLSSIFQCTLCDSGFASDIDLSLHLSHHEQTNRVDTIDKNNLMGDVFASESEMHESIEDIAIHQSSICPLLISSQEALTEHITTYEPTYGNNSDEDHDVIASKRELRVSIEKIVIYECTTCPQVFTSDKALTEHMATHAENKAVEHGMPCQAHEDALDNTSSDTDMDIAKKRCFFCGQCFMTACQKKHLRTHLIDLNNIRAGIYLNVQLNKKRYDEKNPNISYPIKAAKIVLKADSQKPRKKIAMTAFKEKVSSQYLIV